MKYLTIAARLRIMAALPLAILLGISVVAWFGLKTDGAALKSLQADNEMSRMIGGINTDMYRIRMTLANAIIVEEPPEIAAMVKSSDERMTEIMRNWNAYIDHGMSQSEKEIADKAGKDLDRMLDTTVQPALVALRRGDREAAKTIIMHEDSRALSNTVREQLERLQALQESGGKAAYEGSIDRSMMIAYGMTGAFILAAIVLFWFSLVTNRAIIRPVAMMRAALVEAQRSSDLTQRVAVAGKDEVAQMARAFNALMESLQETLNRVMADAQQVSTAATQMAAASH
jgi:methyl-accepting chemotaxis protein